MFEACLRSEPQGKWCKEETCEMMWNIKSETWAWKTLGIRSQHGNLTWVIKLSFYSLRPVANYPMLLSLLENKIPGSEALCLWCFPLGSYLVPLCCFSSCTCLHACACGLSVYISESRLYDIIFNRIGTVSLISTLNNCNLSWKIEVKAHFLD